MPSCHWWTSLSGWKSCAPHAPDTPTSTLLATMYDRRPATVFIWLESISFENGKPSLKWLPLVTATLPISVLSKNSARALRPIGRPHV